MTNTSLATDPDKDFTNTQGSTELAVVTAGPITKPKVNMVVLRGVQRELQQMRAESNVLKGFMSSEMGAVNGSATQV